MIISSRCCYLLGESAEGAELSAGPADALICLSCPGLTPYAIDASTLGERDEDQEHAGLQCFPPWEGWGGGAATGHRTEQLLFCITVL